MNTSLNEQRLQELERRYRVARAEADRLALERNRLVLASLEAGLSQAEIGRALGLTRKRIHQIAGSGVR